MHNSLDSLVTHEDLFPNFYIINLPSIIAKQFTDGRMYLEAWTSSVRDDKQQMIPDNAN